MDTAGAFILGLFIGQAVCFLTVYFGYRINESEAERARELITEAAEHRHDNTPELIPYG
jgi:hypothetical protein